MMAILGSQCVEKAVLVCACEQRRTLGTEPSAVAPNHINTNQVDAVMGRNMA